LKKVSCTFKNFQFKKDVSDILSGTTLLTDKTTGEKTAEALSIPKKVTVH